MVEIGLLAALSLLVALYASRRLKWKARPLGLSKKERKKTEFMSSIVEKSRDGIVIKDIRSRIIWANKSWCDLFGYQLSEIIGKTAAELIWHPDHRPENEDIENFKYDLDGDQIRNYERQLACHKDGHSFWIEISRTHHKLANGKDRIVAFIRDISETVEREDQLKAQNEVIAFRAEHDTLTSAANRGKLVTFFEETRARAIATGKPFGLLHLDLDYFKTINDSFGHAAGDEVIVAAAKRMKSVIGDSDLLARIGGDEFVVVCPDATGFEDLQALAGKIIGVISKPILWDDKQLRVGVSVGAAFSSGEPLNFENMMQQSDIALYEAKKQGRGLVACYDNEMNRSQFDRSVLAAELAEGMEKDQLRVYLQPQFSLIAKSVTGFEALIRWHHPKKGVLEPAAFMDVARELGIIGDIDRFAAVKAFAALRRLHQSGHKGMHISLNVSDTSIANGDYPNLLKWEADKNNLQPEQVTVEILETTFLSETDKHPDKIIRTLSKAGFRIELDNFGTGYAGLSHLGRLGVNGVKIDKSMIRELSDDVTNQIIVQAMVGLSTDLGLRVVAEGVANSEDAFTLRQFGCTNVQGRGISEPLEIDDLERWLAETDMDMILSGSNDGAKSRWAAVT